MSISGRLESHSCLLDNWFSYGGAALCNILMLTYDAVFLALKTMNWRVAWDSSQKSLTKL